MTEEGKSFHLRNDAENSDSSNDIDPGQDEVQQKSRRPIQVSRPPSGHLSRVDEEPSTTENSHSRNDKVETTDRGVGPTPAPPPNVDTRLPPYYGVPSFLDPRNGLHLDPHYIPSLPLHYPHIPYSVNQPLALNSHTLEGRYHWPPSAPFHHPMPGLPASPTHSDVSLLSMRSPLSGEPLAHLASRIHWEQLQRNFQNSPLSRRYSPASLPGLPLGSSGSLFGEVPPHPPSFSQRSVFSENIPPTPGSGSITLPGSVESSRLTSPRPSVIGRSRKRALSHSPISDYLDIQSLTRSSEGSLQLTPFLHNSRSSSAASGSYGHLSAASLGAPSPAQPALPGNPYLRSGGSIPGSPFLYPMMPPMMGRQAPGQMLPPTSQAYMQPKHEQVQIPTTNSRDAGSSIVSSTVAADTTVDAKRSRIKKEAEKCIHDLEDDDEKPNGDHKYGHIPQEGEPDFIETNCHWTECTREFDTQDELVRHINQDHIQANKKSFVCKWNECNREEKPFKAQYMLVVHMRRHTGEKPHRCTFEGCNKAYSRLENLKTHLRSHTGEKPYMCEFPGCTKAFSNASDRAKHQNRTHSNAKPYVCKAIGCTKRYTDPSSLRKHVKTVHGPEFYANKKHKGGEPFSCNDIKKEDKTKDEMKDDNNKKVEECLTVTSLHTMAAGDRRKSQVHDNVGTTNGHNHPSPQSSPEVNVTSNHQPEIIEEHINGRAQLSVSAGSDNLEEEVDIPEPDEADVPGSSTISVLRTTRMNIQNNRLKSKLDPKCTSVGILPQIPGNNQGGGKKNNMGSQPSLTDLSNKVSSLKTSPQHKRIMDLAGQTEQSSNRLYPPGSRRDSNTSTLSSYMSSLRSDVSPFPLGSQFSSRRSSETSQLSTRLSIANSPYEYDITGNLPRYKRASDMNNIGNVTAQLQKAHLGSQPNLVVQSQAMQLRSPSSKHYNERNERLARFFATRRDMDGARTSTPCRTPLPHELPNREVRRASDPVRVLDPNMKDLKRLQRFLSLNMMKPLPVPQSMKSLLNKAGSNNTFRSSRSSIATDYSLPEDQEYPSPGGVNDSYMETDNEAALEEKMMEDNEDMIIPDDMRRFLNERYGDPLESPPRTTNATFSQNTSPNHPNQFSNQTTPHNAMQQPGYYDSGDNMSNMAFNNQELISQANNMNMMQEMQMWNQGTNFDNHNVQPNMPSSMLQNNNSAMMNQLSPNMQMQDGRQMQNMPANNMMYNNMPPPSNVPPNMGQWQQMNNNMNMQMNNNNMMPRPPCPPGRPNNQSSFRKLQMQQQMLRMQQQMQQSMQQNNKQERESPLVQVPHISQSQIPPNAKRNQMLIRQQQQEQQQMNSNMNPQMCNNSNPVYNAVPPQQMGNPNFQQRQMDMPSGASRNNYNMQQFQQQQQDMNMQHTMSNTQQMYNQNLNNVPPGQQGCVMPNGQQQQVPFNNMQMSPGCNQVTSSTDRRKHTTAPPIEEFMDNINNLSAENLIDNIASISTENINGPIYSPTNMTTRSTSQSSSRFNPVLNTNNMVVNDMSSVLTQLAEENKFLQMRP